MRKPEMYDSLAALLAYPDEGFLARVDACIRGVSTKHAKPGELLEKFASGIRGLDLDELEELYTRTFDINPVCTLEIGWHLYGEDYERGKFLVNMRQLLRDLGLEETAELPDHLTHVLRSLGRLEGPTADAFAGAFLLPALEIMLTGATKAESPYEPLLRAVAGVVREGHNAVRVKPKAARADPPGSLARLPVLSPEMDPTTCTPAFSRAPFERPAMEPEGRIHEHPA